MDKVINLADIEFKDEIVKLPVFDNEQSSLTLISFKKGSKRALHVDKKDEVAQIIKGKAKVAIGDKNYILNENKMIIMPALIPHGLEALEDTIMLLLRPKHTHNNENNLNI